jgi:predicted alpha/beta hydrolase
VGLTATVVALIPITTITTSVGISLAGIGSISLTAKLVWLTWFSNKQYALMMAALRHERQRP